MIKNYIQMIQGEFQGYNSQKFIKDLFAGLTTTAVALPLAIAFGVSSGVDASSGLITAVIAGVVISILSGAYFQISGPTGAMAAILIGLLAKFGLSGIFIATFMAGLILLFAGLFRLGALTSFIPAPVITGFTSGIAIIIALGQVDNFFGVKSEGSEAIEKLLSYGHLGFHPNLIATAIGIAVILFMIFYPKKWSEKIPASLVAIVFATALNVAFRFNIACVGEIPKTLMSENRLSFADVNVTTMKELIFPAVSIALLGMIESLLCGAVAGRMVGNTMDANQELVAQGIGNIILPFFGGIPATAAIARTSVAIKSGSLTRLTGVIHALGLLISMLLLSSIMKFIPLSALAGVLMVTAFRMNEWESIRYFFQKKFKGAIFLFLLTMCATVIFDLSIAIVLGFLSGLLVFILRNAVVEIDTQEVDLSRIGRTKEKMHGAWEVVYVTGPLFFMSSEKVKKIFTEFADNEGIIFSMRGVPSMDTTILQILREGTEQREKEGKKTLFSSYNKNVSLTFERSGFLRDETSANFFHSVNEALETTLSDQEEIG